MSGTFRTPTLIALSVCVLFGLRLCAQTKDAPSLETVAAALEFREIGPAVMGGRIADIVVNPDNNNIWYVAVGSGGVWKTTNRGTTWEPVFDAQASIP